MMAQNLLTQFLPGKATPDANAQTEPAQGSAEERGEGKPKTSSRKVEKKQETGSVKTHAGSITKNESKPAAPKRTVKSPDMEVQPEPKRSRMGRPKTIDEDQMHVTVYLPKSMHKRLKICLAHSDDGDTMASVLREVLEEYLREKGF